MTRYDIEPATLPMLKIAAIRAGHRTGDLTTDEMVDLYRREHGVMPNGVVDNDTSGGYDSGEGEEQSDGEGEGDCEEGEGEGEESESDDGEEGEGEESESEGEDDSEGESESAGDGEGEGESESEDPPNEVEPEMTPDEQLEAIKDAMEGRKPKSDLDEDRVREIVHEEVDETITVVKVTNRKPKRIGQTHKAFKDILIAAQVDPVMMVGPAGSGKTTMGELVAESLDMEFGLTGAIQQEHKLMGFIDANGNYISTTFRRLFENGGVFLFDEMDGSAANALLAFNAALSNGFCDFPDGMVKKHENFIALAALNTWGAGADRDYVGRYQQDGTVLDRFSAIYMDYDERLERKIAGDDDWTRKIQAIRKAVRKFKLHHIVSPRASIRGAKLLKAGMSEARVLEIAVWKGMEVATRRKVEAEVLAQQPQQA